MNKKILNSLFVFFIFIAISCAENVNKKSKDNENSILGAWGSPKYSTHDRVVIQFKENNEFIYWYYVMIKTNFDPVNPIIGKYSLSKNGSIILVANTSNDKNVNNAYFKERMSDIFVSNWTLSLNSSCMICLTNKSEKQNVTLNKVKGTTTLFKIKDFNSFQPFDALPVIPKIEVNVDGFKLRLK